MTRDEILNRVKQIQDEATEAQNAFLVEALALDPTTIPPPVTQQLLQIIATLEALLSPAVPTE